jgi:hypothetical protein
VDPTHPDFRATPLPADDDMRPGDGMPAGDVRVEPGLRALVAQAVADLARRRRTEPPGIRVVQAAPVTWPDRSMGCPREGMIYPQVQVDGALVVLEAEGVHYHYHSAEGRAPFLCLPSGPAAT